MCSYAEENKYDLLSKFESLEEFNNHFEQTMLLHKDKFTKSEYVALNKLRKFAADIFGVAWCKAQKAVAATHKDSMFGISRSTFDRMLRVAKKLNLITVKNQFKENKYQKHNVYVFNRLEELTPGAFENPKKVVEIVSKSNTIDAPLAIDAPRTILLELPKIKDNTNITVKPSENKKVDKKLFKKNALLDKLPTALRGLSVYFDDTKDIRAIAGVIFRAKSKVSKDIRIEEHEGLFRNVIASVFEYWKQQVEKGNESYNVFGLMYIAVEKLCKRIVDGTAYEVQKNVSKAPKRKIENVPQWMADKAKVFGNTRSEMLPEWFADRNEEVQPVVAVANENVDFAAKQAEFHARLAELHG